VTSDRSGSHDLRLVGFAVAMWGACLLALRMSAPTTVGTAAVVFVLGAAVALVRRCWGPRGSAVALAGIGVLLGVVCGLFCTGARIAGRDAEPLAGLARSHATVSAELTISDDPRPLAGAGPGPATYLIPARLTRFDSAGAAVALDARVLVFASDAQWHGLLPSQRVTANGTLDAPRGGDLTAAVLSAIGPPTIVDSPSWIQVTAGRLRAGLQHACLPLPPAPGGLLPGLVIGDTSRLAPGLEEQFRTTGLTHLVAVSGANVG